MKILFWLKNKFLYIVYFLKGKINGKKEEFISSSSNTKEVIKTSGPSYKIETQVFDLLSEISNLKEQVSEKLNTFEKAIIEINDLKQDAQKTLVKSEKTENMVYIGFLVFLTMIAALAFGYFEFVVGKNDDYKHNLSEKINSQETEMKILKNCLKLGGWNKCF